MIYWDASVVDEDNIIDNRDLTIAVIGQGKMGLPIDVAFLNAGYRVIGVDVNPKVVELVSQGNPPIVGEPGVEEGIRKGLQTKKFECTLSLEYALKQSDVIIIIIPILLNKYNNPDLQPLIKLIDSIAVHLRRGQIIILESTVPPLTTETIIKPHLERISNLKAGIDFGLAFAPERTYSGRALKDIVDNYPKIVGGINKKTTDKVAKIYASFVKNGIIKMSSATAAEAVKVFKGVYRDVNIALANELAKIAEKLDVDIMEVIAAANTEPYSHIHYPGPGVGGHCIPVYPQFLINVASEHGLNAPITKTARAVNLSMPSHVINRCLFGMNKLNKALKSSKVVVLGLAYRGNVKESRNSPSIEVIKQLKHYEPKELILHDPLFTSDEISRIVDVTFDSDLEHALNGADCILILTDHDHYKSFNFLTILKNDNPCLIVDTKNLIKNREEYNHLGHLVIGIGN